MIQDLLNNAEYLKLEKEYPFLSRARGKVFELEHENYIIVDLETTGLDPATHEIIEIGALKIVNLEVKDVFNTLVKPRGIVTPQIEALTGISPDMLVDQPSFSQVAQKFLQFVSGETILVCHNVDFDIPFLKQHYALLGGKNFNPTTVCTLKASRFLYPGLSSHKLKSMAQHFGIEVKNAHRALGDVETTFQLWLKLIPELRDKKGICSREDLGKITS
ncbi:3'-5' exonuclease [Candidatus Saganbacteria bacterium]|nr:3'-5' exonuclease [Candidatus Saganbacteria bacterium]